MMKINKSWELVNGKWEQTQPHEEVALTHEQVVKNKINEHKIAQQEIRKFLADSDIKVTKYRDQLELVSLGLLDNTSMSQDEYNQLLIDKQSKREQHSAIDEQIYALENPTINTEEATPYENS